MARFASYLEGGAEIISIGSCVTVRIDEERQAAFSGTKTTILTNNKKELNATKT